jgi:hypothetical protein
MLIHATLSMAHAICYFVATCICWKEHPAMAYIYAIMALIGTLHLVDEVVLRRERNDE